MSMFDSDLISDAKLKEEAGMEILNVIQKALKAPKSQRNTFGNYDYRSCEDILEAVKPLLGEAILTISDEIVLVGDRYYVKATATLTLRTGDASTRQEKSVTAYAREAATKKGMDEAQITGAASSYARKYALSGLFAINDTKDPDALPSIPPLVCRETKGDLTETLHFGKFKGKSLTEIHIADSSYLAWLLGQVWFNEPKWSDLKDKVELFLDMHRGDIKETDLNE